MRRLFVSIALCLLGLLSYFGVWAIRYRLPASPARVVDLRKSADDSPCSITFVSSLADNPIGFPGHAYVVWSPSIQVNIEKDQSTGFMPTTLVDQIASLVKPVHGVLLDHVAGNTRNLSMLTIIVSRSDFCRIKQQAMSWNTADFQVGKHDCAAFTCYVASLLNLRTGSSAYIFPQDFVEQLKRLN